MAEPFSVIAGLTAVTSALTVATVHLYHELRKVTAERLAEEKASGSRTEAFLRAAIERDRELSERDDRIEDLLLSISEAQKHPRTRATTDPKKVKEK